MINNKTVFSQAPPNEQVALDTFLPQTLQEHLYTNIGEALAREMPEDLLLSFATVTGRANCAKWLKQHCPDFQIIVAKEKQKLMSEIKKSAAGCKAQASTGKAYTSPTKQKQ